MELAAPRIPFDLSPRYETSLAVSSRPIFCPFCANSPARQYGYVRVTRTRFAGRHRGEYCSSFCQRESWTIELNALPQYQIIDALLPSTAAERALEGRLARLLTFGTPANW